MSSRSWLIAIALLLLAASGVSGYVSYGLGSRDVYAFIALPIYVLIYCWMKADAKRLSVQPPPGAIPMIPLALALLTFAVPVSAVDISANASRDAARLVSCMRVFDAACANSLTYTKVLEEHGISRSELEKAVTNLYGNMKSTRTAYSRFDLEAPWSPFVKGGRSYVFVPYNAVLEGNGRRMSAKGYFIGVSEDSGVSWKFVDGQQITNDTIGHVIPGYVGKLPDREVSQTASVLK